MYLYRLKGYKNCIRKMRIRNVYCMAYSKKIVTHMRKGNSIIKGIDILLEKSAIEHYSRDVIYELRNYEK